MIGNILNSVPGVGHVKGVFHYATGDPRAGREAMYAATRSTAVMAGGAVGMLGGPVGMVAGAAAAGAATDTVTSIVTDEPHGVFLGVSDIVSDISDGKVPLESTFRTGLLVGTDIVGGMGGASISQCATKAIGESVGKSLGKDIVKQVLTTNSGSIATRCTLAHGASRVLVDTGEHRSRRDKTFGFSTKGSSSSGGSSGQSASTSKQTNASDKKQTSSSSSGSSGGQSDSTSKKTTASGETIPSESSSKTSSSNSGSSGGQPPKDNKKNINKKEQKTKVESHWEAFLKIFKKKTLDEIVIGGVNIFKGLNDGQKKVLKMIIAEIRNSGYLNLEIIVDITQNVLSQFEANELTFQNFQSVIKFVLAYVHEQIADRCDAYNQSPSTFPNLSSTYDMRRIELADIVTSEIRKSISSLLDCLKGIMNEIKDLMTTIKPQFVNILAAVYHYFKHKLIPEKNIILTPVQYFDRARVTLIRLQELPEYETFISGGQLRIVYERFYADIGKRLMIVLKIQAGKLNLSSCYYIDDIYEDDEDGDEWINGIKLPRE